MTCGIVGLGYLILTPSNYLAFVRYYSAKRTTAFFDAYLRFL